MQEKSCEAGAAFFDIDGTLLEKPSLERRFWGELRRRGKIPIGNCLLWLAEFARLAFRDPRCAAHSNKAYLHGVATDALAATRIGLAGVVGAQLSTENLAAAFFPAAVQRVWWHAMRGDAIVLVSGTLRPLAEIVKYALERELLFRGLETDISVLATELQSHAGCWTGRVVGEAMFGEAKARALRRFANERVISLARCSAYGDSWLDRWMLASAGNAFAVNPSPRLRRLAIARHWQAVTWTPAISRPESLTQGFLRNRLKANGWKASWWKTKDEAAR